MQNNAKRCHNCNEIVDIGNLGDVCANCGGNGFELVHINVYWFDLAVSYGYERTVSAAVLIREFFDAWNPREYNSFKDFMQAEVFA